jgi:hypothetical protein
MAYAAPTQLGTTFSSNTSTQTTMASSSVVFPTNGQAVLGLFLIAISGTATAETITCADNLGNTWTVIATANNTGSNGAHTAIAYFLYPSGGSDTTATVTVSWGTACNERFGWYGYTTGHHLTSPQDVTGTALGGAAVTTLTVTTSTPNSGNLAENDELGLYSYHVAGAATPTGLPVAGFTTLANPHDATRSRSCAFGYSILTGTGAGATLSAGAFGNTASSLTPPTASIATFKQAAAAAGDVFYPEAAMPMYVPASDYPQDY